MWYELFSTFENVGDLSTDDVAVTDLPTPQQVGSSNNIPTSPTENHEPGENSDSNNDDYDDVSDSGSEDIAQFSGSENDDNQVENEELQAGRENGLSSECDTEKLSEYLDSDEETEFINGIFNELQNSRTGNGIVEYSETEEPIENGNSGRQSRKRKRSETGLDNDDSEVKRQPKKINNQFKNVNVYINVKAADFETDSE